MPIPIPIPIPVPIPIPIYTYIYIYIYICIYDRHLGSINAPPLICVSPPNNLFHYSFTIKKARHIQNYGQDFTNHSSPLMGGPLCENKYETFI